MSTTVPHDDIQQVPSLEAMLADSHWMAYARFSPDGVLLHANSRLLELCGARQGQTRLSELVVEGQRAEMARLLDADELPVGSSHVHFIGDDPAPVSLVVHWFREGDELVLIGEPPYADIEATQATLVKLNGRVSVLARDNAKKSAQIEHTLNELRETQSMLVHREKMSALGQMTAGVAHEINNPLAYVKNNLFLLEEGLTGMLELLNLLGEGLDCIEASEPELFESIMAQSESIDLPLVAERMPEQLAAASGGIERASRLVDTLRTFSRLDEAEVKTIDLNDSLRSVVEFVGFLLSESDSELTVNFDDLPLVTCSPGHLNQAILNILTNAIQAASPGGKITLSTRSAGGEVLIEIADNGPGVPEDLIERIFDPFFTTRRVGEGTGLGLSIAHSVATAQGGSITVANDSGGGARFTVHLPVEEEGTP